jgi:hypothetical protein
MLDGTPQEYFFPGGLQYRPQTVIASSIEEAQEIYEKTKQKVEQLPDNNEQTSWQKESEESSKSA